jgi:4-diphosphocytidyl-2-C-methyl-D-erythritol kinase
MPIELDSPCKINLLLNILGRRADGFHELETVMQPVALFDHLTVATAPSGITLTCSDPALPGDRTNLVWRAAQSFLESTGIASGLHLHLEKRIPMAAGLGGGSGNAATTLLGLNRLFGHPLDAAALQTLASGLGSDVPFFLHGQAALATGRGEQVQSIGPLPALRDLWVLLIHPGFGIATAWAYQQLARFPAALNGRPGRAAKLVESLTSGDLRSAAGEFYNSLEAPALDKYPVLALYQDFCRTHGAEAALMSGSGSTTFALVRNESAGQALRERFVGEFGDRGWTGVVPLGNGVPSAG